MKVTTPLADTQVPAKYKTVTCQPGLGDGLNTMSPGTYSQSACLNEFGATFTITAIKCYTDNNGTSTLNATNGAGTALLAAPITCTNSFAAGTQSATTTIAPGDFVKFSFTSDGEALCGRLSPQPKSRAQRGTCSSAPSNIGVCIGARLQPCRTTQQTISGFSRWAVSQDFSPAIHRTNNRIVILSSDAANHPRLERRTCCFTDWEQVRTTPRSRNSKLETRN